MTSTTAEIETGSESDSKHGDVDQHHAGPGHDDINVPVIVMVGIISTIVTICIIFFVQGLCYLWQNSYIRDRSLDFVNEPVRAIVEDQKGLLTGEAEGIKSIDETMNEVIEKFGEKAAKK